MLSIPHLIVIFVVALVVFGPEKLPELARSLGKIMAEFRRHTNDLRSTFEGHLRDLEREADARKIAGSVTTLPSPQQTTPQPASSSPGTVPSNTPYAAAVAAAAAERKPEEAPATPEDVPDPDLRPRDPGSDPYLMSTDFTPADSTPQAKPSEAEKVSERVTDGDTRPL